MIPAIPYVPSTKISEPGLYAGVPMAVYHGTDLCADVSASSSLLRKIFTKSARHAWATSPYNPNRVEEDDSEARILGRASHHLLLSESDYAKLFSVRPDKWDSWRTNDAKKWRAEQIAGGVTVLEPKQIEQVRGMADALHEDPLVKSGILDGLIEHTIIYRDNTTGLFVKVRPDAIPNYSGDFADLKSTTSVTDDALERAIGEYAYDMQGSLIGTASREALLVEMTSFTLIFVEKKPPHCVRCITLRSEDLARAEKQNRIALRTFAHCMKTGFWPGPGGTQSDAAYLSPKPWHIHQAENRLAELERELAA